MIFERTVLTRGSQMLILRSTLHGSSEDAYQELKDEVGNLKQEGYYFLIEGVYGSRVMPEGSTLQEQRIAALMAEMFNWLPHSIGKTGFVSQRSAIQYPTSTIHADLSFIECAQWMYNQGLRLPRWIMPLMRNPYSRQMFNKIMQQAVVGMNAGSRKRNHWSLIPYYPVAILLMPIMYRWKKYSGMLHDHRNRVAVRMVEETCKDDPEAKILMHYGRKHKAGIVELLITKGWRISVQNFPIVPEG